MDEICRGLGGKRLDLLPSTVKYEGFSVINARSWHRGVRCHALSVCVLNKLREVLGIFLASGWGHPRARDHPP